MRLFSLRARLPLALTTLVALSGPAVAFDATSAEQPKVTLAAAAGGAPVNAYRSEAGLDTLERSSDLDAVARRHSADMAEMGQMTHTGSDGSDHTARLQGAGCAGGAENVAEGPYTEASVVEAWMSSPRHRRNILLSEAQSYGLGNVGDYWTLVVASGC